MLQRNITDSTLLVMGDPPVVLHPGDLIEHEDHVTGCEPVEEPEPAPVADAPEPPAAEAADATPPDAEETP